MVCADLHGGGHPLFTFSMDFEEKAWFWKMKNCMFSLFSVQFVQRLSSGFISHCNKLEKSHKVLDSVCVCVGFSVNEVIPCEAEQNQ